MPLYLQDGALLLSGSQLAATRSCCCEEEGDKCDFCADSCNFAISVLSPAFVTTLPPCAADQQNTGTSDAAAFNECFNGGPPEVIAEVGNPNNLGDRAVVYFVPWDFELPAPKRGIPGGPNTNVWAAIRINLELVCFYVPSGVGSNDVVPTWFLELQYVVSVGVGPFFGFVINYSSSRNITKYSLRPLSSPCKRKGRGDCIENPVNSSNQTRAYPSLPLEITLSSATDGFGEWQQVSDQQAGLSQDVLTPCLEQLLENFTATFRITERPACTTVQCNCGSNLNGLKALFEGKTFTLGTDEIITDGNTTYEHYNEPITGAYQFFKTVYSPGDENCPVPPSVISLTDLSLTCETDNSVSPAVVRWLTTVTTSCTPVEIVNCEIVPTGFASRLFTANIPCYEAEDNCTGPVGGTHIPLGSPQDIVEDEDSPFLDPGLPNCGAPNFPDFRIEQACGA